jgi:hypothetical protein
MATVDVWTDIDIWADPTDPDPPPPPPPDPVDTGCTIRGCPVCEAQEGTNDDRLSLDV